MVLSRAAWQFSLAALCVSLYTSFIYSPLLHSPPSWWFFWLLSFHHHNGIYHAKHLGEENQDRNRYYYLALPSHYHTDLPIDRGGTFTDVWASAPNKPDVVLKLLSVDPGNYQDAPTEGIALPHPQNGFFWNVH